MQKLVKYIFRLASIYFFLTYFMLYVGTMPFSATQNMLRNSNDNQFMLAIGVILVACIFFVLSGVIAKLIVSDQRDSQISNPDNFNRNVVEIGVIFLGLNFFIQGLAGIFHSGLYRDVIPMMIASSTWVDIIPILVIPILNMLSGYILIFNAKNVEGFYAKTN